MGAEQLILTIGLIEQCKDLMQMCSILLEVPTVFVGLHFDLILIYLCSIGVVQINVFTHRCLSR